MTSLSDGCLKSTRAARIERRQTPAALAATAAHLILDSMDGCDLVLAGGAHTVHVTVGMRHANERVTRIGHFTRKDTLDFILTQIQCALAQHQKRP